jgi:hypothetical protein
MAESTADPSNMPETKPLLDKEPDDESQGCGSVAICNPRRRLHRYIILIFICSLSFGKHFLFLKFHVTDSHQDTTCVWYGLVWCYISLMYSL